MPTVRRRASGRGFEQRANSPETRSQAEAGPPGCRQRRESLLYLARAHTGVRHDSISPRRAHGHTIGVEGRSVEATKAVRQHQLSHRNLRRSEQRQSRQASREATHVCKRESENSESAKGAVGEGESGAEGRVIANLEFAPFRDFFLGPRLPCAPGHHARRAFAGRSPPPKSIRYLCCILDSQTCKRCLGCPVGPSDV